MLKLDITYPQFPFEVREGVPFLYEVEFASKDGMLKWFEVSAKPLFKDGAFTGYIGTTRDISEKKEHENEVKRYIAELEHTNRKLDKLATFDMLTGVYNRRKFEQDMVTAVEKKEKYDSPFSIIMFDIDGFKQINVEAYDFEFESNAITISAGVSEFMKDDNIDPFLSIVDNALLKAKAKGKNRVEFRS